MKIIPAIDIKGGKCVRLLQGDFDKVTTYGDDPIAQALQFEKDGAELIHLVDLDGAYEGKPINHNIVIEIANKVKIPVEIGGGIRTLEHIENYVRNGVDRIIIGTKALDGGFIEQIVKYQNNIVIGIDAKDGMVATHGWINVSNIDAMDFINKMKDNGFQEIIFTDISTDGMLEGPNLESIENILENIDGISLTASGGVSVLEDLINLSKYSEKGLTGAIVGKAIYDGRIKLKEAVQKLNKI